MNGVPRDWTDFMGHFCAAQTAQDGAKLATTQQLRDIETARYARSLDAMMVSLTRLSQQQVLGQITLMLARKERR